MSKSSNNNNRPPATVIPFNKPCVVGQEIFHISQTFTEGHLAGEDSYRELCNNWLKQKHKAKKVLLTTSCTAALELAAMLADIQPGDEVIIPSYTFPSTANAFVLRGAVIKFIDIRPDTLNMDEKLIEKAVSNKTKVIIPVHYAGVSCEMDSIMTIAETYNLLVIEDAAQAVNATYKGKHLGTIGHLGTCSFHETKNIHCGEGGALFINDESLAERAEILSEKGTTRSKFLRGEVERYSWVDTGFSSLPSEITAAFLWGQLEQSHTILKKRREIFDYYYKQLTPLHEATLLTLPSCPQDCIHNSHMFFILTKDTASRNELLKWLNIQKIEAVFHYIPLHTSPMGRTMGYTENDLPVTEDLSSRLIRLPCYLELSRDDQERVIQSIFSYFSLKKP